MKKLLIALSVAAAIVMCAPTFAMAQEDVNPSGSSSHYGTVDLVSTFASGETMKDSFYLSDDWFTEDPGVANDALALASMQAVASVVDADEGDASAAMLKKMGFGKVEFVNFDSDETDDCAFVKAEKPLPSGGRLVAVVIQSYSMDSAAKKRGWTQNFVVNGDPIEAEHYAFAKAAVKAYAALQDDLDLVTKYWVMGQSRGGAIANLLATYLPQANTYAYTFEAPATVADPGAGEKYPYIHNYICADDPVTMIPPWGMTRYGQTHSIDLTLAFFDELEKLESAAVAAYEDGTENPDVRIENIKELVAALEDVVKQRDEYSMPVALPGSGEVHTYQAAMANLMGALFGGGFDGLQTEGVMDRLGELRPSLDVLARAIKERNAGELAQSDKDFWTAAAGEDGLLAFLGTLLPEGRENPLSAQDLFMILKLVADPLIDEGYEAEDPDNVKEQVLGYISPVIGLIANKDALVYSHQFDTVIARLKAMSPAPKLESFDAAISQPVAGDDAGKAVAELAEAIDPSLSPEISWAGGDAILQDDKTYNLKVLLHVPGRTVEGDFAMTINGQEPVSDLDVAYIDGEYIVKGVWAYTFGTPDKVRVTFDTCGKPAATPDSIPVDRGSLLGIAAAGRIPDLGVVHDDGKAYKFESWHLGETFWEDVVADDDLTLAASWKQVVDRIDIAFDYPKVGEGPIAPTVAADADYRIASWEIVDDSWKAMTVAENKPYTLCIDVTSDEVPFLDERDDSDEIDDRFLGSVWVNGEKPDEISYYFDDDENQATVYVTCYFTPAFKKAPAARYLPLRLKSTKQNRQQITLSWNKVSAASSYEVYGALKNGKSMKKLATVAGSKCVVKKIDKKLKKGAFYKFVVKAKDAYGNTACQSKPIYVATKGSKKANYKSVQVKVNGKVMKKAVVKKGKTLKIKATGVKPSKRTVVVKGIGIRYESSDAKVATVSAKGVITGVNKGTCTVYAYAPNGVAKALKVTVK